MDGFEFLDELRGRTEWQGIPVVVVTAKDLTEEDVRGYQLRTPLIVHFKHDRVVTPTASTSDICEGHHSRHATAALVFACERSDDDQSI